MNRFRNLLLLSKIEMAKTLSSFRSNKRKSSISFFLIVAFVGLMAIGMSAFYSWLLINAFKNMGEDPAPVIALFSGIASMLILMSSINHARGLYIGDDYDMLASLPIGKPTIVASKIINLFSTEATFSSLIMIPHAFVLLIMTGNVPYFFIALTLAGLLPMVPIAIACFLSLGLTMATARFKYANVVILLFYAVVIIGFSLVSFFTRNVSDQQLVDSFSSIGNILKWINPSYILMEFAYERNLWYMAPFIGTNIIVMIITVLFLALCFDKLHALVSSASGKRTYVAHELKNKNETRALLSLEFKRLVNSKMYFLNSAIGAIMGIVATILMLVSMNNAMNQHAGSPESVYYMRLTLMPIFLTVSMMVFGINNPSVSAISIEGKNFWIMKSLPVNYKKYMRVKLVFPLIIFVPACLIASTIAIIFMHDNAAEIIMAYVMPLLYVLFSIEFGLIVNLKRVKLKWNNEAEVVKSSSAVVIAMLANFGIMIVLGAALIVGTLFWSFLGVSLIVTALLVAGVLACYIYLDKNFARKVIEIEDF